MRSIGKGYIFALSLMIGPFLYHNAVAQDALVDLSAEQWREDLHYMVAEAIEIHDNIYHTISRESFDSAVVAIDNDIPNLSSNQIVARFAELVRIIGDGHTGLRINRGMAARFHQFPMELYLFKDGWFVRGAMLEYKHTIGSRVVAIDNVPIDDVYERLKVIIPHDNEWSMKSNSKNYIVIAELLNGLEIIEDIEGIVITLEDPSGAEITITPKLVTSEEYHLSYLSGNFIYGHDLSEKPLPLWLKNFKSALWYEYLEDSKTLYVKLSQIQNTEEQSLAEFTERMLAEVDALSVEKLIIDMRLNHGGNNFLSRPLFRGIMARPEINQEGRLFVITGRVTFSAASYLVTYFETHTNALFVGEPMGGSPNHYGDAKTVTLPNSGLQARFSSLFWQNSTPIERRKVLGPDLSVQQTSAEYFSNIDPCLEAIMQFGTQEPLIDRLSSLIASGDEGYERAKEELTGFVHDPLHEYYSAVVKLNNQGYALLGKHEISLALAIFRLNIEVFPENANAWDSYAEALALKGDTSAAIVNYQKAFEMNPKNTNAQMMIERLGGN